MTRDGAPAVLLLTGDDILPPGLAPSARAELQAAGVDKYLGAFTPAASEAMADGWTKHTFDTDGGAGPICVAGTPFTTFTQTRNPNKVLVFLQGGGACWQDFYFCNILADSQAPPFPPSGIWDFDSPENPFADYSIVYMPYCDGSVHTGDKRLHEASELARDGPELFHALVQHDDARALAQCGTCSGASHGPSAKD